MWGKKLQSNYIIYKNMEMIRKLLKVIANSNKIICLNPAKIKNSSKLFKIFQS